MTKKEFNFKGAATKPCELHAVVWCPENNDVKKVLQITHGMTEHMGRYEDLAEHLTKKGIALAGFDLRGHGANDGDKVCASFGKEGWKAAIEDMHLFYNIIREEFPEAEHYILGFSLGSFLLREYLNTYSEDILNGAVIMGTGHQPSFILSILLGILKGQIKKAGWDKTTPLVQELSFGTYNKKFKPNRTASDWLCSDEKAIDAYIGDELCRKDISAGLFSDLLTSMKTTGQKNAYENWRKDMPVLLISGKEDPVGDMSKGVERVQKQMKAADLKDVKMVLLDGGRHDILHEEKSGAKERAFELIEGFIM